MKTSQTNRQNKKNKKNPMVFTRGMQEKLVVAVIIVSLALFALLGYIYYIQKNNNEEYNKIVLSQRQSEYTSKTIPYRRGDIFDRNGTKLATSTKVYNLILDPRQMYASEGGKDGGEKLKNVIEPTIEALASFFDYDEAELRKLISEKSNSPYVKYQKEISYEQKQGFLEYQENKNNEYAKSETPELRKNLIKGVWFEDEYKRIYPYNELACNVLGFSSADGTVGTGGVEQFYNDSLIGTNGREYGYLNDEANLERVIKSAENGNTLILTLDANIQKIAEKYLAEWENGEIGSKSAACIVMNPNNGEVLAMASTNQFDLNNPRNTDDFTEEEIYQFGLTEAVGVYKRENPGALSITEEQVPEHFSKDEIISYGTQVAWNKLWRNICVSDTFEPGSTQKIFTVAGAMEEGIIGPHDTFNCEGNVKLSDGIRTWRINCVNRNGHGLLDVTGGLTQSCNVVMMNIAFLEKSEIFMKYQKIFGFGDYTGIDLPAEINAKTLGFDNEKIGKTTLATQSFGQNYNCTMIQMAAAYASAINGGNYYEPHVVKQVLSSDGRLIKDVSPNLVRETISKSTSDFLRGALFQTVDTGTGKAAGIEGYTVGGKTGTAQKLPRSAKTYVVSFCGFAPVEDPQLLCYVVIDEPKRKGEEAAHSSFASQIFAKIMKEALPIVNCYPDGVESDDIPDYLLPYDEGDSKLPMGSKEETDGETEAPTEVPTDENGETLMAPTIEGETVAPSKEPLTEEFIQGDDNGEELPDELSSLIKDEDNYNFSVETSPDTSEENQE